MKIEVDRTEITDIVQSIVKNEKNWGSGKVAAGLATISSVETQSISLLNVVSIEILDYTDRSVKIRIKRKRIFNFDIVNKYTSDLLHSSFVEVIKKDEIVRRGLFDTMIGALDENKYELIIHFDQVPLSKGLSRRYKQLYLKDILDKFGANLKNIAINNKGINIKIQIN